DPFVQRNVGAVVNFNYLNIYIENGGEFWLSGAQPTDVLWDFGDHPPLHPYPFNVTNWDEDPPKHPDQDSVGVTSFLYKLGAEAVDIGAGGRGPAERDDRSQYCIGFVRAEPQGYQSQTFRSDVVLDHSHDVEVPTMAVDDPPADGITITTSMAVGHVHTLFLSREQLLTLQSGGTLDTLALSVSPMPHEHSHRVTLCDRTGLWGAPARLEPETGVWAVPPLPDNPLGGRPNVELYNMAPFLAQQQPPL